MNTAVARSPFDSLIAEIKANPQYLNEANGRALIEVVKSRFPALTRVEEGLPSQKSPQELLNATIISLGETIQKLNMAAVTAEGGLNTSDLSKLLAGQEKYIKILERLSSVLSANDRQIALENAVTDALDETSDSTLKERFLTLFRAQLGKKSQNLSAAA